MKRQPVYFQDYSSKKATGPRYNKLSKADWADAFCHLYRQVIGEPHDPGEMLEDAEQRVELMKEQGIR